MTPGRRELVERIIAKACALDPEERRRFLDEACAGDPALRREVESQLWTNEEEATLDESPPAVAEGAPALGGAQPEPGVTEERLGRYRLQRRIGAGGFGAVYLAFDDELKRPVAIKVPCRERIIDAEAYLNEARTSARLTHPGVVPVYDVGRQNDGTLYVVMMFVDGPSLERLMETVRPSPAQAAGLMAQVAEAVHHAHTHGFVHRDLKPNNILLDRAGKPYVADFGLALHEEIQTRHKGDTSGTPSYRSPEQVRGQADWLDGRCDIWALGVILYELLTGRRPFFGDDLNEQILNREPRPPRMIDDTIPESLERICLKCLAKTPDHRYLTADALAKDLRDLVQDSTRTPKDFRVHQDAKGDTIVTGRRSVTVLRTSPLVHEELPPAVRAPSEIAPNPYKGLAAFHEGDAHFFFGREREVERLWECFRDLQKEGTAAQTPVRLLAILGPSGCGKSSLARAGLIAELARRSLPSGKETRVAVLTPGSHPLESLGSVLARMATGDPAPVAKTREFTEEFKRVNDEGGHDGLRRIASLLSDKASASLVLLVDQFEEVYSLCDSPAQRTVFADNLLNAAADRSGQVSVIITLRSDFLGETQDHQRLNGLIAEQGFIVPAMTEGDLRRAIAEPAQRAGYTFHDSLVDLLIKETHGREGALLLLQFALTRIWDSLAQGAEPLHTLRQIGGVGGALAGEAERIYDGLDRGDKTIARRVFLALIQLGEGTRDTRRRVPIKALAGQCDDPAHVRNVIARFSSPEARLVTLASERDGTETAEVTHEALLDHWQRLKDWLDASREDIRFQRRLDEAARHWHEEGRPKGILWRSPDLDLLREFHGRAAADMTPLQADFFFAADRQEREEKRRQRRRVRFYKGAAAAFGLLLALLGYLGYTARQNEIEAQRSAAAARQAAAAARNANLAARRRLYASQMLVARNDLDDRRVFRIRELLEGLRPAGDEEDLRGWEWYHMQGLLHREILTLSGHAGAVRAVEWSPNGLLIASGGDDQTIRIWNPRTAEVTRTLRGHTGPVFSVAWSPDSVLLASASGDGSVALWDTSTGLLQVSLKGHTGAVQSVAWSPCGHHIASGGTDRTVVIWDASTARTIRLLHVPHEARSVAWSPDARQLAVAHGSGDYPGPEVTLWYTRSWSRMTQIDDGPEESRCVAWSPDGQMILFGAGHRDVKLFDVRQARVIAKLGGHRDDVAAVVWNPSSSDPRCASASRDQTIRIWNSDSKKPLTTFYGHRGAVNAMAWSPNGLRLASGSDDGVIKIWDPSSSGEATALKIFPNWIAAVNWHPTKDWVAVAYLHPSELSPSVDPRSVRAASARIWDIKAERIVTHLRGHTNRVWYVAWSPRGDRLATASMDKTAKIWSATGEVLHTLAGHRGGLRGAWWSPDGTRIATAAEGGTAIVWDAGTGAQLFRLTGARQHRPRVAWSPDGGLLALATARGAVQVYDAIARETVYSIPFSKARSYRWSPRGRKLAIGSTDGYLQIWDFEKQSWDFRVRAHHDDIKCLAWSPAGRRIVTGSRDGTVRIHDARTGLELFDLHKGLYEIRTVAWSPDGKRIAAGSWWENAVRVWDASKGYTVADMNVSLHVAGYSRAVRLLEAGRHADAGALADRMASRGDGRPQLLLEAARIYAEAAAAASALPTATTAYTRKAIQAIERLADQEPGTKDLFTSDPSLKKISGHADVQRFLDELSMEPPGDLVPAARVWKYLDAGPYPAEHWKEPDFDDTGWLSGPAPLGYGGGDVGTVIRFGGDPKRRRRTTHFRRRFTVQNADRTDGLILELVCKNGAAVYLNGTEVLRHDLRPNALPDDLARAGVEEEAASASPYSYDIDPELLTEGENVLAVEVHVRRPDTAEVRFALSLRIDVVRDLAQAAGEATSPFRRREALRQLAAVGERASAAIPALVTNLSDDDADIRRESARVLGLIGQAPAHAVSALVRALGDKDANVRHEAAQALTRFAIRSPDLVEDLEDFLNADDSNVRAGVCRVMGAFGPAAARAADRLRTLAADADNAVRYWAVAALHQIDPSWAEANTHVAESAHPGALRHREFVVRVLSAESWETLRKKTPSQTELGRALRLSRTARALAPQSGMVLSTLGIALYRSGDFQEAVTALTESAELLEKESLPPLHVNLYLLAFAHRRLGNTAESDKYFEEYSRLTGVTSTQMDVAVLRQLGAAIHVSENQSITGVDLAGVEVAEEDGAAKEALQVLVSLDSLEELNLSRTDVGDAIVTQLKQLSGLKQLVLSRTRITTEALRDLGDMTNLRALNLSHTAIGDEGLRSLKRLNSLELLWLSHTNVTDAGLKDVKSLVQLTWLDLEGTPISDTGLDYLKDLEDLQTICVGGTRVSAEGIGRLKDALPGLTVRAIDRTVVNVISSSGLPAASSVHGLDGTSRPAVLAEDAIAFVDRPHEYNGANDSGIPDALRGAEYIRNGNSQKQLADFRLQFDLVRAAHMYLLIDDRVGDLRDDDPPSIGDGTMEWVLAMGFVDSGLDIGIDEVSEEDPRGSGAGDSIEYLCSIFVLRNAAPGHYALREQAAGPPNMYGVAVVPVE